MASKITILTVGITALLLGIIIFTFINYEALNANEGWGMVAIFYMFILLLSGFFVEIVIKNRVRRTVRRNTLRTFALACYIVLIILFFLS